VKSGRRIPHCLGRPSRIVELLGLGAARCDSYLRKATIAKVSRFGPQHVQLYRRRCGIFTEKDLIPVDAKIGDNSHLPRVRQEFAGKINHDAFRFAGRHSHILDYRLPLSRGVLDLQRRKHKTSFVLLSRRKKSAAVGPVDPAAQNQNGAIGWRRLAEVEREGVYVSHTRVGAAETVYVAAIADDSLAQHILPAVIPRAYRIHLVLDAEKSELRERRVLEFVVREYLSIRGMVKRDQLHFVEIGDLS